MLDLTITTGGKGTLPHQMPRHITKAPQTNLPTPPHRPLPQATTLLSLAFATDPVITYLLHSMSAAARALPAELLLRAPESSKSQRGEFRRG
jgi:hypothetical protein